MIIYSRDLNYCFALVVETIMYYRPSHSLTRNDFEFCNHQDGACRAWMRSVAELVSKSSKRSVSLEMAPRCT